MEQVCFTGTYLGGHESFPDRVQTAYLVVNADGVFIYTVESPGSRKREAVPAEKRVHAPWAEVLDIEVDGSSTTQQGGPNKAAVLAFGVYGLASGHKSKTTYVPTVIVRTTRGNISFLVLTGRPPASPVSAQIAMFAVKFAEPAPTTVKFAEPSGETLTLGTVAETLTLLTELHGSGLLSDDEFSAKRAEVL